MPRLISTRIKQQLLILTTIFIRIRSKKENTRKKTQLFTWTFGGRKNGLSLCTLAISINAVGFTGLYVQPQYATGAQGHVGRSAPL